VKIHIHVGGAKTGSSSIQLTLTKLRDDLSAEGVLYPDIGAVSHTPLLPALLDDTEYPGLFNRRTPEGRAASIARSEEAWDRLKALSLEGVADMIISSEYILGLRPVARRRLHERFSALSANIAYYAMSAILVAATSPECSSG
jgi:hypothetical protein